MYQGTERRQVSEKRSFDEEDSTKRLHGKRKQNQANSVSKSQVINVEKSRIGKFQSKDLFQKVSKASNIKSEKMSNKQLINVLNNKISQKDNLIRQLHTRLDELISNLNKEKELVIVQNHQKQCMLDEKQKLCQQNAIQQFKIKEMNQSLRNLNEMLGQTVLKNIELIEKCKVFELQIKERQNEITSLWQIALISSCNK